MYKFLRIQRAVLIILLVSVASYAEVRVAVTPFETPNNRLRKYTGN